MPFEQLKKIVDGIIKDLPKLYTDAVLARESKLIAANRAQLSKSKNWDGSTISPEYAPRTQKKKGFKDPDLKDTGGYYDSIYLTISDNDPEIYVNSNEVRDGFALAQHLETKYGENILGVPDKDENQIKDEAIIDVINEINRRVTY